MLNITCDVCKIEKPVHCTDEHYQRWRDGELIQRAMPDVPAGERELLVSGVCGECFDKLFGEEEE